MRTTFLVPLVVGWFGVSGIAAAATVTFQLNDAAIKDQVLANVHVTVIGAADDSAVAEGDTDDQGQLALALPAGNYLVSYRLAGYVPVDRSPIEVSTEPVVITTTLSMMLEASGDAAPGRRVRIILNWGSNPTQVRDADSHLLCPLDDLPFNLSFEAKEHDAHGQSIRLDVDDVDWGGPETITLLDPQPGSYPYWVHNFSGPLATLGASDVVVRVLIDDAVVGEFRPPPDHANATWRPFDAIVVEPNGEIRLAEISAEQKAAGAAASLPPGGENPYESIEEFDQGSPTNFDDTYEEESCNGARNLIILLGLLLIGYLVVRQLKKTS